MSPRIRRATLEKYFHRTYGVQLLTRIGTIATVAVIVAYVGAMSVVLATVWTIGYAAGELALMRWWRKRQTTLSGDDEPGLRRMTGELIALSAALSAYAVIPCLLTPFQGHLVAIVGMIVSAGILMTVAALHSLNRHIFLATAPVAAIALVMNLFALGNGAFSWLFAVLGLFFVFNARSLQMANARSFEELVIHQVEAEDALVRLQESEGLYRLLADNQTDTISLWSDDWNNRYMSPSSERALGFSVEERRALPRFGNLHEDDRERVGRALGSLKPGDPPISIEFRTIDKQGAHVWLENTVKCLDTADGGYLMTSRVITERKRLEGELLLALDEAKTALQAKSDFLANMTHELRTPLNAIIGFSGVLKDSPNLHAQDSRQVEIIWDASRTLLGVVNDVLDYSKLEANALEFEAHPFDPVAMADSTVSLLADLASAKGLEMSIAVEGEPGLLVGDGSRLRQVLTNLLSNAVKFTPRGQIVVSVRQQDHGAYRRLRIAVSDTGIGVPPDQIEGIFGRFTQADASVSRQFGGTGLGLAISKRIIEAQGGEIGVESTVGKGATFWFELSLPAAAAGSAKDDEAGPGVVVDGSMKLLLVDDNPINRELVCTLLAGFDIEIETASDGVEAIQAIARSRFDLVLMDVQMPIMDGLTATRRIRAEASPLAARIPIIAMTANVLPEQIERCLAAGMDDHLGKPINPVTLLETLSRWAPGEAESDVTSCDRDSQDLQSAE